MVKIISFLMVGILLLACKKKEDRKCWKSFGDQTLRTVSIDSVQKMRLLSGLTYVLHQSNDLKVDIIGGENMVDLVSVDSENDRLEISNLSFCNFLRDFDKKIVVHIYYPEYSDVYAEVSDSLIFADTIKGERLKLEMRESGGVAVMTTDINNLNLTVSAGNGHYVAKGYAKFASFKTQGQSFADCTGLKSKFLYAYQNSRGRLKVDIENVEANIVIEGAGDVIYSGEPKQLSLTKNGAGNFIKH